MIRGGGSLESLQAFNNETIVRAVADFPVPVIAGIGHDKDVPLVSLSADTMVSTPTAATVALNRSWQEALRTVLLCEQSIMSEFGRALDEAKMKIKDSARPLERFAENISKRFAVTAATLSNQTDMIGRALKDTRSGFASNVQTLAYGYKKMLSRTQEELVRVEKELKRADPSRALSLGFSLVWSEGKLLRSVDDVGRGDTINITVSDGSIEGSVVRKNKQKKDDKNK